MKTCMIFSTAMMLAFCMHAQQTLHVPGDFLTIQAAVDAADYGDTVLVDPGRYFENVIIQGNLKAITLASQFINTSDTMDIKNTIIDAGNPQNPNYGMGILLKNIDTTLMPKIIGFTIKHGSGYYRTYGGGIMASQAIPVIEYNRIDSCSLMIGIQPTGGGIRVSQGMWDTTKVCVIRYNIISNCTVNSANNTLASNGGGISLGAVNSIVEGNIIKNNKLFAGAATYANANGAGILCDAANPFFRNVQLTIKNNIFSNNYAEGYMTNGGALAIFDDDLSAYVEISGNVLSGNEVVALQSSGNALGGAIVLENIKSGSLLADNIIADNTALNGAPGSARYGGGIHLNYYLAVDPDYYILISGNRMTGNRALRGGAINCQNTGIRMENNFISQNEAVNLGGAIFLKGQSEGEIFSLVNNTFTGNLVSGEGGQGGCIYMNSAHAVLLMNNIFWENSAPEADEVLINISTMEMYNCDINDDEIAGEWTGSENFKSDPQFINEMMWDPFNYDAPCYNAGIESVSAFGTTFYAPDSCIGHNPRPLDGAIDVGACEVDMLWVGVGQSAVGGRQSAVKVFPNPTDGVVDFRFSNSDFQWIALKIYNAQGQEFAIVMDKDLPAGEHVVRFDMSDFPPGIYFYEMSTIGNQKQAVGKLVLK